jgi:hypothetical protein
MAARARADTTQAGREHYALLCLGYLRLAEQVDRRSQINSVHEMLSPVIDHQIRTHRILQRLLEHIDHLRMAWLVPLVGISLLTIDVAFAQQAETSQQRFKRLLDCKFSAGQLIGLTRAISFETSVGLGMRRTARSPRTASESNSSTSITHPGR